MGRPVDIERPNRVDDLSRRHSIARRLVLETVPLDSNAYRRHAERLRRVAARGGALAERVAAYERTVDELGLADPTRKGATNG